MRVSQIAATGESMNGSFSDIVTRIVFLFGIIICYLFFSIAISAVWPGMVLRRDAEYFPLSWLLFVEGNLLLPFSSSVWSRFSADSARIETLWRQRWALTSCSFQHGISYASCRGFYISAHHICSGRRTYWFYAVCKVASLRLSFLQTLYGQKRSLDGLSYLLCSILTSC